ncbi:MAG TPA: aromatic ring-hydroxylating dioxygenase subunit alpha [Puia sp.]|nr:aromatic ring-hydroxylating dioxygenase subunit alpha [Puia sp.]
MPRFFIDPDIAKACTLPANFYADAQLFELAKEKLFAPSWQFIGDSDSVAGAGQARPLTVLDGYLDEPVALVSDQDRKLRLLSNACTHRGNLVVEKPCRLNHLRCRYHGRQFELDGRFRSMPEFREVENFPSPADSLRQLPLETWGKWMFTTMAQTDSWDLYWGDLTRRLSWLPLDNYVFEPELTRTFAVRAHWALYCENYLEGFHIPFVHADLNTVIDFGNYTTELFRFSSLQMGIARRDEDCFELPSASPDYGKNVAAYYFFVFPNTMFNFYPWGLSVNVVIPVTLNQTRVVFYTYLCDRKKYNKGAGSGLDAVELEDEEVVESVQKGIRSRWYTHGRYSVTREQGTHHFHRMIAGQIG